MEDTISATIEELSQLLRTVGARFSKSALDESIGEPMRRTSVSPDVVGVAACARILADAGLLDDAEAVLVAAVTAFPNAPIGCVGLAGISMRRGDWTQALTRWDDIMSRFVDRATPQWMASRATVLANLGRADEAVGIFRELIDRFDNEPFGHVGMAQLAMLEGRWETAADRWGAVVARFGGHVSAVAWKTSRAATLLRLGQAERCVDMVRMVLSEQPASLGALVVLLSALVASGRSSSALTQLESSPLGGIRTPKLKVKQLQILINLGRIEEARSLLTTLLEKAWTIDWLDSLFTYVPLLEGRERTTAWGVILERAEALATKQEPGGATSAAVLGARACLALRDRKGFATTMRSLGSRTNLGRHDGAMRAVAGALSDPRHPDSGRLKIFGIGLSKTGTTSLAAALRMLGWNTLDWSNPLTCELLSEDDLYLFDAFTDTPCCVKFEYWYHLFPNSKFICTVRPMEQWIESINAHWRRHFGIDGFQNMRSAMDETDRFFYGQEFRNIHKSLYFNYLNYKEAYAAYRARVANFFQDKPRDRFMEFNLISGQGWGELCGFIGAEIPDTHFPHENRRWRE